MKPRDFYITVNEYGEPSHIALFEKLDDRKQIHVREVMSIDWKLLYVDYCLQTQSMDNFELIKELVEKQLAGEE